MRCAAIVLTVVAALAAFLGPVQAQDKPPANVEQAHGQQQAALGAGIAEMEKQRADVREQNRADLLKALAAIGGGAAASNSFDALLKKNLPGGEGYSFAGKYGLAADRKTVAAALKSFETRLQMEKPETVRICFDSTDVVMGRTNPEIQRDLERIVQKVLDLGAVPVLFTLPMLAPPDANTRGVLLTFA